MAAVAGRVQKYLSRSLDKWSFNVFHLDRITAGEFDHTHETASYFALGRAAKYIAMSMSVRLSVRSHTWKRPKFTKFSVHVHYSHIARSSSCGVAIRYVVPVLCITVMFSHSRLRGALHACIPK